MALRLQYSRKLLIEKLWLRAAPAAQRRLAGEPNARPGTFRQVRYEMPIKIKINKNQFSESTVLLKIAN